MQVTCYSKYLLRPTLILCEFNWVKKKKQVHGNIWNCTNLPFKTTKKNKQVFAISWCGGTLQSDHSFFSQSKCTRWLEATQLPVAYVCWQKVLSPFKIMDCFPYKENEDHKGKWVYNAADRQELQLCFVDVLLCIWFHIIIFPWRLCSWFVIREWTPDSLLRFPFGSYAVSAQ